MSINLLKKIKDLIKKDELCGEWDSDDGTGFIMIMGAWMKINTNGTGKYENWSKGDYNYNGEFEWERIGKNKIRIQDKGSEKIEEIKYKLEKINGRIELTSSQPELEKFEINAFWKFGQIMFKKT